MNDAAPESIAVQIVGQRGFVWRISDVLRLRKEYRLIGRMVGGVSGYKSQVAVGGLPLQLEPEEVALALEHGWVRLYEADLHIPTAREAAAAAAVPGGHAAASERIAAELCSVADEDDEADEYYAAYYGLSAEQAVQQGQVQQAQAQAQAQQGQQGQAQPQQGQQQWTPPWASAVSSGARYQLPLTVEQLAASLPPGAPLPPPLLARLAGFAFPRSAAQAARLAVFRDLHRRGYSLTGGAKFGGDWLAYPGDPALFHSQFVVRLVQAGRPMCPVALRGGARGVHTARKHMVLASVVPASGGGGCSVRYLTVAKADGFGGLGAGLAAA